MIEILSTVATKHGGRLQVLSHLVSGNLMRKLILLPCFLEVKESVQGRAVGDKQRENSNPRLCLQSRYTFTYTALPLCFRHLT